MKNLLADYRNYLQEQSAPNTVMSYMSDLTKFMNELKIANKRELTRVKPKDIEAYITLLKSRGMAYSSVARTVASLKKFFSYCRDENVLSTEPTAKIEAPKTMRKLPSMISPDEIIRLLEAPDGSSIKGKRDRAMLEIMYATGARISEIVSMKTGDIVLKNEVAVLSTGGKRRFVPLGKAAVEALYAYLREARGVLANEASGDTLFLNLQGMALSRQGFWKIIKHYIAKTGINEEITAQTIRHCFALHLLNNGADEQSVSEMLGYSDVSSTKIYVEVLNNRIKEVYKNAHPRA